MNREENAKAQQRQTVGRSKRIFEPFGAKSSKSELEILPEATFCPFDDLNAFSEGLGAMIR